MRHGFPRIEDQSIDDLFDLGAIHFRMPEIRRKIDVGAQVRAIKRELSRLRQERRDGDDPFQRGAAFGKGQQLTGKMGRVLRGLSGFGKK